MQLRQLEYFVAVAEQLSFTKAARQFYISQSAVTIQIRTLEEEMGVQLFSRTNRKVELTPAGRSFLEDAQAILRRTRDAMDRARRADIVLTGHLHLGFVKGYEKTNLSDLLSEFHIQYPNISLTLTRDNVTELYDGIFNGSMDLCLNVLYSFDDLEEMEQMDYLVVKQYALMAVMPTSHPLAHRFFINREELKGYPLVDKKKNESRYGEKKAIVGAFARAGFLPKVSYISDDIETTILAVAAGLGYALMPSYITDALSMKENVISIPIAGEEKLITIIAAWKKGNSSPGLKAFLNSCLQPAIKNGRV
jgi:DNA-binding transcriptional LysR family regulator